MNDIVKYIYGENFAQQVARTDELNLAIQNAMNLKYCMMFKKNLENTIQELERKEHGRKEINVGKS